MSDAGHLLLTLIGGLLLGTGILITTTSGLCTLFGLFTTGGDINGILLILGGGCVSCVVGLGLFLIGRQMLR